MRGLQPFVRLGHGALIAPCSPRSRCRGERLGTQRVPRSRHQRREESLVGGIAMNPHLRPFGIGHGIESRGALPLLVRYDNEAGKSDHRHVMGCEESYRFVSVAKLRRDFEADIRKYGGGNEKED